MIPIDRDEPVYMISVAARICRLHPQTLRMYERLGFEQTGPYTPDATPGAIYLRLVL